MPTMTSIETDKPDEQTREDDAPASGIASPADRNDPGTRESAPPRKPPSLLTRIGFTLATLCLAVAVFAPAVLDVRFYTKGEPREALVVQAIVQTGEFVLPYRNGDEIPSKPPFFHWMGALTSLAAGAVSETSVRIPSVVAALAAMVATVAFALRAGGPTVAWLALAALLTSPQWTAAATTARVDMMLAGLIAVGLFAYFDAYREDRPTPGLVWLCGAAATLTKGPIGLALPGAIVLVHLLWRRDWDYLFRRTNLRMALVAVALVGAWYGGATWVGGQPFLDKLILKENVLRVLDGAAGNVGHLHPFYWYVPAIFAGMAPWSLFLPLGLRNAVRTALNEPRERCSSDPSRFLLVWFAVTFVVFSIADSKRGVYLLPGYPAAALLIATSIGRLFEAGPARGKPSTGIKIWVRAIVTLLALAWALILLQASGVVSLAFLDPLMSRADRENLGVVMKMIDHHATTLAGAAVAYLALGAFAWRLASGVRQQAAFSLLGLSLVLTYAAGGGFFLREIAAHQTVDSFMPRVANFVDAETPLYAYPRTIYQAVYYSERPIPPLESAEELADARPAWVLVPQSSREEFDAATAAAPYEEVLVHTFEDNPRGDHLYLMRATAGQPEAEVQDDAAADEEPPAATGENEVEALEPLDEVPAAPTIAPAVEEPAVDETAPSAPGEEAATELPSPRAAEEAPQPEGHLATGDEGSEAQPELR